MKQIDLEVGRAIARNPRIVENEKWIAKHPQLAEFFERYPGARDEIEENPGNFVVP